MARQPNILFMMTDHTNAQALAPGSQCRTPNLSALAAQGMRFHRFYTTNAICSPARASLMTGLFPSTHGMWDCTHTQRREWVDVPAERFTYFSHQLAAAGYYNAYFGKWHVEQSNRLEDFGWHEYDVRVTSARAKPMPGTEVRVPKEGYRDYILAGVSDDAATRTHPAVDRGIEFLRRYAAAGEDRPFCCFVSASEPHDPYVPPRRFFEQYPLDSIRLSPTLREEPTGKPEVIRRMRLVWEGLTDADWRKVCACYWATISYMDSEFGRLLQALRDTGLYENTIVVFTSDHGDMQGAHGLVTKGVGTSYEPVYNIPLILRVPGMSGGCEETEALASMVDLAPTLLDLCGAPPLPNAQGRSLRPVLEGRANPDAWQDAYAEFFGQRFVYTQRIVWHQNWKYVFSPGGVDELYNLADDPHERHNLAEEPAARNTLHAMVRRMWRRMRQIGDESLFNTQYATLRTAPIGPDSVRDEA
ncbi:MAG: sulfatase-like hydrolase/transferase [Armatimonadota bacterium]|nr:sulfatase-like hydrolase/transferase [Armatimonadota bacterium]